MPNIKISELPVATVVNDADVVVLNQAGVTKQAARSLVNAPTGTLPVANGGTGRQVGNYSVYGLEIHVGKDGNDTTGDGTLINPVLTITKALTLIVSGRNTIVVHPGVYSESPTVSGINTTITTTELTGANTLLSGTLTLSAAARVSGLKMSNLTITGSGNTYISNCTVDTRVIKSGTNYVEIINSELQCTSGIQITGAGAVSIVGNKCWAVAVSNAAANVLLKDCFQVVAPSVSAGNLQFDGCAIFAAAPTTNAVTSSAGSSIALANSFVLNSAGTNVERVSLLGSYSILNLVYDKTNSTLTGTNLNAIDYFSVINADTLNLTNDLSVANGGTGQGTFTDGQLLIGNSTGNTLAKATLTAGTNVTITNGPGTITIAAAGGSATPTDVQTFVSSGTWTKPAGAVSVNIQLLGGGGGGGAGRKDSTSATVRCGGGGGGGGSIVNVTIPASLLGLTESVAIGGGGGGGPAQATDVTNGTGGSSGTATSFGVNIVANGGTGGGGGTATTGTGGSGVLQGNSGASASATGGAGSTGVPSSTTSAAQPGGASGASGAGLGTSNTPVAGASGGRGLIANLAGGLAGAVGANATNGNANTLASTGLFATGSGGGSGGSSIAANGGNGGSGGFPAAAGGGGAACGFAAGSSGAGGAGAAGMAIITTYF